MSNSPLRAFANKLSGKTVVDNKNNPDSASYKMSQSVGKPNPKDPQLKYNFKSTLPKNQKTFGVPGAK